ncbi:MAG: nucleotide exchange factor GrpE [Lachnospiraceae bacterium]|nr:nucleotide exchange factor GrpE [Lachnospiraceae bacterium]
MAETDLKQDQEIDQNKTDETVEPTQTGQSGADESADEETVKVDEPDVSTGEAAQTDTTSCKGDDDTAADESGDTAAGESTASTAKEKKSFFSKKDKNKEKDKDKERIAELEDRVMRQMAEFENFRRRSEKEKQQMFETGARSVIEKILPVVDNFERGLSSIPEAERQGAVAEGMNMIYKQLQTELDNIGVKAIDAVGQEFDPAKHNAVMQVTSEEYESGIVAQELQKGYTYRDTVIRHSMVAVVE